MECVNFQNSLLVYFKKVASQFRIYPNIIDFINIIFFRKNFKFFAIFSFLKTIIKIFIKKFMVKKLTKKYFWEFILILSALSYSFEWYFVRKLSSKNFSPIEIAGWRLFFCSIIIGLFFLIFNRKVFKMKNIKKWDFIYLLILSAIAIFWNWAFNIALLYTSVANILILVYLWIFWWFLLWVIFFKEKFSTKKLMYIIMAFLGISLALMKDFQNISFQFWKWEILALCISFIMGISVVTSKSLSHINAFFRIFISFSIASILIISFLLFQNWIEYFYKFFTIDFLFPIFILALTAWVLGRWLKELGTNYVPTSIVLVIMLLEPIMQMTTAYIFAGEKLSFFNIAGIFIVLSMAVLISRKKEQ